MQFTNAFITKKCEPPIPTNEAVSDYSSTTELIKGCNELWVTGRLADFTISVGSKEFRVYKFVLTSQTSVLEAMFENDLEEQKLNTLVIKEFSATSVKDFLQYLYTGQIMNTANAMELFALAARFNVPGLKSIFERIIVRKVDESNAHEIYSFGHLNNSKKMISSAFAVFQKMFPEANLRKKLMENPESLNDVIDGMRAKREAEKN